MNVKPTLAPTPKIWTARALMDLLSKVPECWMDAELSVASTVHLDGATRVVRIALNEDHMGKRAIMLCKEPLTIRT